MKRLRPIRSLTRNSEGATAVEFALIASLFLTMLFSIIEYGLFMMTQVALESVVSQAGRKASVTTGSEFGCAAGDRPCVVRAYITHKAGALINANGVKVTAAKMANNGITSATPFAGDLCLTVNPPAIGGPCPAPTQPGQPWYQDLGGGSGYQSGTTSYAVGGPGDIIEIVVTYPWRVINPIVRPFFANGVAVIQSRTIVKNEN